MAEHGLSTVTAKDLRDRMESRFGFLHYNEGYGGRHASDYDFLAEMLADEVIDDGLSDSVTEDNGQLLLHSAPVVTVQGRRQVSTGGGGDSRPVSGLAPSPQLLTGGFQVPFLLKPQCFP